MRSFVTFVLVLLAAVLVVSCGHKQVEEDAAVGFPSFVYTSYDDIFAAASEADRPFIIDFYTDW